MAVAQHDNGWWEWDTTPELAAVDRFPSGLADVLKNQQVGMSRWRLGLRRFDNAPYANLLISYHAYWLYAAKTLTDPDPAFGEIWRAEQSSATRRSSGRCRLIEHLLVSAHLDQCI